MSTLQESATRLRSALGTRLEVNREIVFVAALAVVVMATVFLNEWGALTTDTKPELYLAPWDTLMRELHSWKPSPHLGDVNYHAGFAPVALVVWVMQWLGAEPWVSSRLLRGLLLIVAGWGAARHLDTLGGTRARGAARVTAALAFAFNPYAIVSGATLPVLLPYAFFPWMLTALLQALRAPRALRYPAAFALFFFLMGGMNAGVVPLIQLLAVPCYIVYVRAVEGVPLHAQVRPLLLCSGLVTLVSMYWIVPTLVAEGSGTAVAASTEAPEDVASTSSFAESVRLLGMWTMYGQLNGRLFSADFVAYLSNLAVVLASFAIPVLAALGAFLSRARSRLVAVSLIAVGVPVMVGMFPVESPSPFGTLLRYVFERLPASLAFRTTNKAGTLVALGVALLVGLGAAALQERVDLSRALRAAVAFASVTVLLLAAAPAWSGHLHPVRLDVPSYWREAASSIDRSSRERLLWLPGQVLARYRWGHEGVDDLDASLFSRPVVWRSTVPTGSRAAANLLAAFDVALNQRALLPGAVSTYARYLGASQLLLRNDTEWELVDGARPAYLAGLLAKDPGLAQLASFGSPGRFTTTDTTVRPAAREAVRPRPRERSIPPLLWYAVTRPQDEVRAEPSSRMLLVDGDNFAWPSLQRAGLLNDAPPYQLLPSLTARSFRQALEDGGRLVITDSNRRRAWNVQRTSDSYTPTLPPDLPVDPGAGRGLTDDPVTQTVAAVDGVASVRTNSTPSPFFGSPSGRAAFAFDGDLQTAWSFGAFDSAPGSWVEVEFERPEEVSRLVLRPLQQAGARITAVRITGDNMGIEVPVPDQPVAELEFPQVRTSFLRLEVTETAGVGRNAVGLREIEIPGVLAYLHDRMPGTLDRLAAVLPLSARPLLSTAPLDVLMERQQGDPRTAKDDEERRLSRSFTLPVDRRFTFTGVASPAPELSDLVVESLTRPDAETVAFSSSRAVDSQAVRASRAFDGKRASGWAPAFGGVGEWIEVRFPAHRVDHITIDQGNPSGPHGSLVERAVIDLGDGSPFEVELRGQRTRVPLPALRIHSVRMTITRVTGNETPIRINEITVPGVSITRVPRSEVLRGCTPIANLDGFPLEVRFDGTAGDLYRGRPLPFRLCGDRAFPLASGEHRLRGADGWLLGLARLSSAGELESLPFSSPPKVDVLERGPTRIVLTTSSADEPYLLVSGQAFDERWSATMDGKSLGRPLLVDGYSAGWRIDEPGSHRITIFFQPQRVMVVARWISIAGVLACIGLLAGFIRTRRANESTVTVHTVDRSHRISRFPQLARALAWAAAIGVSWLFAGLVGGAAAAVLALWHLTAPPTSRHLILLAGCVFAAVPIAWLIEGLPAAASVSPAIVADRWLAHYLAIAALLLLVAGIVRDTTRR